MLKQMGAGHRGGGACMGRGTEGQSTEGAGPGEPAGGSNEDKTVKTVICARVVASEFFQRITERIRSSYQYFIEFLSKKCPASK